LGISVVDKSVLTLADEKTARSLPTHFLLTSAVKKSDDLEYADFLLGPHPKASEALDLLLGVHGWRHFTSLPADLVPPPGAAPHRQAGLAAGGKVPHVPPRPGLAAPAGRAEGAVAGMLVTTGCPAQEAGQAEWDQATRIRKETNEEMQALATRYSQA